MITPVEQKEVDQLQQRAHPEKNEVEWFDRCLLPNQHPQGQRCVKDRRHNGDQKGKEQPGRGPLGKEIPGCMNQRRNQDQAQGQRTHAATTPINGNPLKINN